MDTVIGSELEFTKTSNVTMSMYVVIQKYPETNHTTEINETLPLLSPMHKYFLAVLVLATVNALLGALYFVIVQKRKRKRGVFLTHEENPLRIARRHSSLEESERHKRRKFSTHIALAVGKNKESARRVSSVYL